jgi:hypothetical protein
MLAGELTPQSAPWYDEHWAPKRVFASVPLPPSTTRLQPLARSVPGHRQAASSSTSRVDEQPGCQRARAARRPAAPQRSLRKQRDLLLQATAPSTRDFYTYRYLASQGFLPGYNFPRLPLMAYIPARKWQDRSRELPVSRPRFLALASSARTASSITRAASTASSSAC